MVNDCSHFASVFSITVQTLSKNFWTPFGVTKGMSLADEWWQCILFVRNLAVVSLIYLALVWFYIPSSEIMFSSVYDFWLLLERQTWKNEFATQSLFQRSLSPWVYGCDPETNQHFSQWKSSSSPQQWRPGKFARMSRGCRLHFLISTQSFIMNLHEPYRVKLFISISTKVSYNIYRMLSGLYI